MYSLLVFICITYLDTLYTVKFTLKFTVSRQKGYRFLSNIKYVIKFL